MPGRAADGLGDVVDETPRPVEERTVEILTLLGVAEPASRIAQTPKDRRQMPAKLGIAPERLSDRLRLERRDPHRVQGPRAAEVSRLAAQIARVARAFPRLLEDRLPDGSKLAERLAPPPLALTPLALCSCSSHGSRALAVTA